MKKLVKIVQTVDIEEIPVIVYRSLEKLERDAKNAHFLIDQSKQKTIKEEELNISHLLKNIEQARQLLVEMDSNLSDVHEIVKGYGNYLFGGQAKEPNNEE